VIFPTVKYVFSDLLWIICQYVIFMIDASYSIVAMEPILLESYIYSPWVGNVSAEKI